MGVRLSAVSETTTTAVAVHPERARTTADQAGAPEGVALTTARCPAGTRTV